MKKVSDGDKNGKSERHIIRWSIENLIKEIKKERPVLEQIQDRVKKIVT